MSEKREYSYEAMKQTVEKCYEYSTLRKLIKKTERVLDVYYKSDSDYIINYMYNEERFKKYASLAAFIAGIITVIVFANTSPSPYGELVKLYEQFWPTALTFALWFIIIMAILLPIGSYFAKTSRDFIQYQKDREFQAANRDSMMVSVAEFKRRLSDCETALLDRSVYLLPKDYWKCAGELMCYIENGRAYNLKEAINLHHEMLYRNKISNMVNDIYQTALNTQQIARDTYYEAEKARIAAQSAEKYAKDAAFYSWLDCIS